MTTPIPQQPPQPPPYDLGNTLLSETEAQITCALIDTTTGQRMVLTVRTDSTTLSVLLSREDARKWAAVIKGVGDQMSGLVVAGPGVIPANGKPVST